MSKMHNFFQHYFPPLFFFLLVYVAFLCISEKRGELTILRLGVSLSQCNLTVDNVFFSMTPY